MAYVFGTEGVFGAVAGVYAAYVFLFILFGAVLEMTKVGDVFVKIAFALVGHCGAAPQRPPSSQAGWWHDHRERRANIVITGTFTIP